MAGKETTVAIVVKARDESQRVLNSAKTALDRFTAAAARTGARRDLLAGQLQGAKAAHQAYLDAAAAAETLGRKLSAAKRPSAALRAEFDSARESARRAKQEFLAVGVAYAQTAGKAGRGTGSFAAFDSGVVGRASAEQGVNRLGDAIARVSAYQQRVSRFAEFDRIAIGAARAEVRVEALTSATVQNTVATNANATALRRQGAAADFASREVAAAASRQGRGFLGLRPYELQNLSYQINDVFTQLASGTPVMQVAAQQGGQFAQLFPKLVTGILRATPIIAGITLALSPFITGMMKANDEAKSLSEFDKLLTRSGNAAAYSAPQLAALAAALDNYGGSLKDARASLTEFVGDAVDPAYLERFGKAALDLAKVMKMDVAEASKTVSDAFTGNADAILALDDQLGFLTAEERKHAEALRKQGRDAELRTEAFAIFERQYGETAAKMRGPWSQILRDFGAGWDAFAEAINLIDFSEAEEKIDGLVKRIQELTAMMPGARGASTENAQAWVDRAMAARNRALLAQQRSNPNDNIEAGRLYLLVQSAERDLRAAQSALAISQLRDGTDPLFGGGNDPADTTTRPPANSARPERDRDGERRAKQQADFLESLRRESVARQFNLSLVDLTERQSRVLTAVEQARVQAAEVGLELTSDQVKLIEAETRALYDAEQAVKARQLIEQATLELAQARGEVETESAFVTRKLQEQGLGVIEETNAITGEVLVQRTAEAEAYAAILRDLYKINEATRQRAAAEKEVTDLTSLRSDLMEQIQFYEDAGQGARAEALREQLAAVNAELLVAVDAVIAFWTAAGGEGAEAALLKFGLLRDQLSGVGENAIVSGTQINEMLAGGATGAVDQFFQSIGNGVNAIQALGDAFRQFAADFLRQIAQMILKQVILNMLQSAMGGSGGKGGGVGATIASAVSGLFRHSGGMVGSGGGYKPVPLSAFAGATRYHTGGIAGLKPDEVPSILKRGEEVLTAGDPRHRANGGGQQAGGNVKVVNVFDPAELLDRALGTSGGEKVLLNFVNRNSSAFKAALS